MERHPLRLSIPQQRRPKALPGRPQRRPETADKLAEVRRLQSELERVELELHQAAVHARNWGATWQQLGAVLGMTARSAWKRYAVEHVA